MSRACAETPCVILSHGRVPVALQALQQASSSNRLRLLKRRLWQASFSLYYLLYGRFGKALLRPLYDRAEANACEWTSKLTQMLACLEIFLGPGFRPQQAREAWERLWQTHVQICASLLAGMLPYGSGIVSAMTIT